MIQKLIKSLFLIGVFLTFTETVAAQTASDWYMAGGNPQRTSWVTEEVRGSLGVEWYQAIEPYIAYKIQPVFYNGVSYISTSKGLYAFDLNSTVAAGGTRLKWIYATDMPLGHSPTLATVSVGGTNKVVAYVGGFDHKIHAVDVSNGQALAGYTPYVAQAGFETNPLVIKDNSTSNTPYIVAGSRDGSLYALNALTGSKIWQFQTGGPIQYSAAYKNGNVYFASNDLYAYAVNIGTGAQIWKSQKFQYSAGFFSYWPVIYTDKVTGKDYVTFTGATNYRPGDERKLLNILDQEFFVPGCVGLTGPTCPNSIMWPTTIANNDPYFANGTTIMNLSGSSSVPGVTTYYENYPHRHFSFILDAQNGTEFTFDSNGNGKPEYAPFTWASSTYAGSKYPAMINGVDNLYYQPTIYYGANWISRSDPVGWKFGTSQVSNVTGGHHAFDEPIAYASGGKVLYWSLCCDREAGAVDVTLPLSTSGRSWGYYGYNLISKAPDYHAMYNDGDATRYQDMDGWHSYSGANLSKNGVYGKHGIAQSPPIPYQGKVYSLKGNTLIAWKASAPSPAKLTLAKVASPTIAAPATSLSTYKQKLESEIQKMISAGPLKPGYQVGSLLSNGSGNYSDWSTLGDNLDYFHNPADTVYTLLMAYPHVSTTIQGQIKTYLQTYYGPGTTYDFTKVQHVGWSTGASRTTSVVPPDSGPFRVGNPTTTKPCCSGGYWQFPPFNFYAAWKYAQIVGNNDPTFAKNLFNSMSSKIEAPTTDTFLIQKPYFTNLYAAGYLGFLELKKLAGLGGDATVQGYYDKVMGFRINNFTKDTPFWPDTTWCGATNNCPAYWRAFSVSRNFAFLTPEISAVMKTKIQSQVQAAVNEYQNIAPFWFVNNFDATIGEGTLQHLYDTPSLFQAKAWILGQSYDELAKYLDSPAFDRGDLFYIQNLVALINAPGGTSSPSTSPVPIVPGDSTGDGHVSILDYNNVIGDFGGSVARSDFNQNGLVDIADYNTVISNFGK